MATPAARAVFGTVELHEAILANVDVKTLLISCQRTCKTWRNVIADSVTLQQKLFFKPKSNCDFIPNPLAAKLINIFMPCSPASSAVNREPETRKAFDYAPERLVAFKTWSSGSFDRMLICQPPTTQAAVFLENPATVEGGYIASSIQGNEVVTIGSATRDLKEAIVEWRRNYGDEDCEEWVGAICRAYTSDGEKQICNDE